jgi:hypothetical protein
MPAHKPKAETCRRCDENANASPSPDSAARSDMIQYGLYRTPRIRQRFAEATTASNIRGNDGVRAEVDAGVCISARCSPTLPIGLQQLRYAGVISFAFNRRVEIEVMLKPVDIGFFAFQARGAEMRDGSLE